MSVVLALLTLFGGLVYLLLGGDLLVRGAIGLSNRTRISPMLAGFTIVAAGTSAPELMVSLYSALSGHPDIALGNVIGSNIANVLLVLAVPALISPIPCSERGLSSQALFMSAVTVLFVALCWLGPLGLPHGLTLLGLLGFGCLLTFRGHFSMPGINPQEAGEELTAVLGIPQAWRYIALFSMVGIIMLPLGADLTVDGAVSIATAAGVSEGVVGASLIAIGTSLPELSTTLVAAYHRSAGVAIGNVIGSNVLNLVAVMGATASLAAVPVAANFLSLDLWVMGAATILLTILVLARVTLGRLLGGSMLVAYVLYLLAVYLNPS